MKSFKGFRKIHEDGSTATMAHPSGHKIQIVKGSLSRPLRKQLQALPLHQADGSQDGPLKQYADQMDQADQPQQEQQQQPQQDQNILGSVPSQEELQNQAIAAGTEPQYPESLVPGGPLESEALEQDKTGTLQEAGAESKALKEQQAGIQKESELLAPALYQKPLPQIITEINQTAKDIGDGYIKPNDYLEHMGAGKKVATAIGLFLGGIGQGFGAGENPAMKFLNAQIERNLQSQQSGIENKRTLLGALEKQYGNNMAAQHAFRAINLQDTANKLEQAAVNAKTPMAIAQFLKGKTQIQQSAFQNARLAGILHLQQVVRNGGNVDPASLVSYALDPVTLQPPPPQIKEKIADEIGKAQNLRQNMGNMMDAFDKADQENTVTGRASRLGFTPPSIKSLNNMVLPFIHDSEGRVNEFEQHSVQQLFPSPGDRPATVTAKKQAFQNFLLSKTAAPLSKMYGIDLSKFQSTRAPKDVKTVKGIRYERTE